MDKELEDFIVESGGLDKIKVKGTITRYTGDEGYFTTHLRKYETFSLSAYMINAEGYMRYIAYERFFDTYEEAEDYVYEQTHPFDIKVNLLYEEED